MYRRHRRKKSNPILWLSLLVIGFSGFNFIKNNPQLMNNLAEVDNQQLRTLVKFFNLNISSIKSLTETFVTDIDEPISGGNSEVINESNFAAIDKKARSIQYYGDSVYELGYILSKYANTDLEKARIIYTWITENIDYDTPALLALKNGSYPDIKSATVLSTKKTICSGYANLYQQLASEMGLKSVIVLGYAKGSDYVVGEDKDVNHAWNAVKIDGKWHLVDTTWGAGTVTDNKFNPKFNPYYFATPSDEFIYTHFPEKQKWQLLNRPYARSEFNSLPEVTGEFFKNDLELISHPIKTIRTDDNLNITLKAPKNVVAIANLKSKSDQNKIEKSYTFVQQKNGYITVNAGFPTKGDYRLDIFAKKRDNSNVYPHIVSYDIIAKKATEKFPSTYSHFHQNNGYVEAPLNKDLIANQYNYFKLRVDKAIEVKVLDKSSGEWADLTKYGNLFTGSAMVTSGKVVVFAKFSGDSRYWALLEYN